MATLLISNSLSSSILKAVPLHNYPSLTYFSHPMVFRSTGNRFIECFQTKRHLICPTASLRTNKTKYSNQPSPPSERSESQSIDVRINEPASSVNFFFSLISAFAISILLLLHPNDALAASGGRIGGSNFKSYPNVTKSKTNIYVSPSVHVSPPVIGYGAPIIPVPVFPPPIIVPVIPPPIVIPVIPVPVVPVFPPPVIVQPPPNIIIIP